MFIFVIFVIFFHFINVSVISSDLVIMKVKRIIIIISFFVFVIEFWVSFHDRIFFYGAGLSFFIFVLKLERCRMFHVTVFSVFIMRNDAICFIVLLIFICYRRIIMLYFSDSITVSSVRLLADNH